MELALWTDTIKFSSVSFSFCLAYLASNKYSGQNKAIAARKIWIKIFLCHLLVIGYFLVHLVLTTDIWSISNVPWYLVLSKRSMLRKRPWVKTAHHIYLCFWFTWLIHKKYYHVLVLQKLWPSSLEQLRGNII